MDIKALSNNVEKILNKEIDTNVVNYLESLVKLNSDGSIGMLRLVDSVKKSVDSSDIKDFVVESLTNLCNIVEDNSTGKYDILDKKGRAKTIKDLLKQHRESLDSGIKVTDLFEGTIVDKNEEKVIEIDAKNRTIKSRCVVLLEDNSIAIRR